MEIVQFAVLVYQRAYTSALKSHWTHWEGSPGNSLVEVSMAWGNSCELGFQVARKIVLNQCTTRHTRSLT